MSFDFPEKDLEFYQGDSQQITFEITQTPDAGGVDTPVDLTGCTVAVKVAWAAGSWGIAGSVTKSTATSGVTITSAVNGQGWFKFTAADLSGVPTGRNSRWSLVVTDPSANVDTFGAGYVNILTVP